MDRAFQRIRSLMLRGTFYSVPPTLCPAWREGLSSLTKGAPKEEDGTDSDVGTEGTPST